MQPFLALITPVAQLPGGGPNPPYPDISPPGPQPRPDHDLPLFPFHPIVVPPGGIWPDQPGVPTHPIVLPPGLPVDPSLPHPDHTLPGDLPPDRPPIVPEHPIMLPPEGAASGAIVIKLPEAEVPPEYPAGTVAGLVWYGPGTYPVAVYIAPRAQPK